MLPTEFYQQNNKYFFKLWVITSLMLFIFTLVILGIKGFGNLFNLANLMTTIPALYILIVSSVALFMSYFIFRKLKKTPQSEVLINVASKYIGSLIILAQILATTLSFKIYLYMSKSISINKFITPSILFGIVLSFLLGLCLIFWKKTITKKFLLFLVGIQIFGIKLNGLSFIIMSAPVLRFKLGWNSYRPFAMETIIGSNIKMDLSLELLSLSKGSIYINFPLLALFIILIIFHSKLKKSIT